VSREWLGDTRFVVCDIEKKDEREQRGVENPLRISRQRWPEAAPLPDGWEELGVKPAIAQAPALAIHSCPVCRTSVTAQLARAFLEPPDQDPRQQGEAPDGP
jgi:hypothetical protein